MLCLPLSLVEYLFGLPFLRRPRFLWKEAPESPTIEQLQSNLVIVEIRDGHVKWAHLLCPKCGDHIELSLAGKERWSIKTDLLRRPTLVPSIWEKDSCGAHFFLGRGEVFWFPQVAAQNP
jgi:ribosomal protein L32